MNPCGKRTRHGTRIGCCATCHELFSSDTVWGLPSGDNMNEER